MVFRVETVNRWQALAGGPLMMVIGEVLLVVCSVSYLVWWTITFRPSGRGTGGGPFLAGAVLGGLTGLVLLAIGIVALLPKASWPAVGAAIVGGVVVGAMLFYVTARVSAPARHHRAPADRGLGHRATGSRSRVADGRGAGRTGGVRVDHRDR